MALIFNGNNYLTKAVALVAAAPMTFACWFKPAQVTANATLMAITSTGAGHSSFFEMLMQGSTSKLVANILNDASTVGDQTAAASLVLVVGTWYHVAVVFASATSRTAYVNGANSVNSTVSVTPGTLDSSFIAGTRFNNQHFQGPPGSALAGPAFYSAALTATEIAELAGGINPRKIRPASLMSYPRLTGGRSPEPDLMSATGWTVVSG